ncbi:hypothetical protein BSKO_09269 [Bryopsis sp. KO-2023]|nr:hypothetical protein BSKO_09269 [Bryopsis sp. KO-2023]
MRTVAFVSFIIIFGWGSTSALTPAEKGLLGEVFDVCGGVTQWSTFYTRSTFHRTLTRNGRVQTVENEETVAQLQKKPRGNYAAYVKASRNDSTITYHTSDWFSIVEDFLSLEIMQGGDFLLKVVEASDKYFGNELQSLGSEWFKPSNSDLNGRLPMGGEFADHVSLGVGTPTNLKEGNLEKVEEISGKEIEGVMARCIEATLKPHRRRYDSKSKSMAFCFSDKTLMEVTETVVSIPGRIEDPQANKIHSVAVRTYLKVNMAVDFPFEPAPFSLPRGKRVLRGADEGERRRGGEEENRSIPSVSIHSMWVYILACVGGLGVLALVVSFISYSEISSLWAVGDTEPLLGAGNGGSAEEEVVSDDNPPLLV